MENRIAPDANRGTLLLSRSDVTGLLDLRDCIAAVEVAFRMHATGKAGQPGVLGMHVDEGGSFHIKAAALALERPYFAAKLNANFPHNGPRLGLPTIRGVLALCDASNGDLHHAIDAGLMARGDVHAELGQIVAGAKRGRARDDEIIVFDSSGTALQDVAAAAAVYRRALAQKQGSRFSFDA